jgi:endonuclease III
MPRQLRTFLNRLTKSYGRPEWKRWGKAVPVLVGTILSQNTTNANSDAGFRQLRRRFVSWNAVADAPVGEVERCIRVCGLSRIKAPRIGTILRQIRAQRGKIDLEFLADLPPREAYRYLLGFDGVGPKTASCVLLFSLHFAVFPVDTHIHRIAKRWGLLDEGVSAEAAQDVLEPLIAPADRYAMHILMIRHGREICRARNPRCEWCCVDDLCPSCRPG